MVIHISVTQALPVALGRFLFLPLCFVTPFYSNDAHGSGDVRLFELAVAFHLACLIFASSFSSVFAFVCLGFNADADDVASFELCCAFFRFTWWPPFAPFFIALFFFPILLLFGCRITSFPFASMRNGSPLRFHFCYSPVGSRRCSASHVFFVLLCLRHSLHYMPVHSATTYFFFS
jgi:hypothetical protein